MLPTEHFKLRNALRYQLLGAAMADRKFQVAVDAFNFVEERYEGDFRKDGKTPSFQHPLEIMGSLLTLVPSLRYPAETLAAAMLHDCVEDKGVSVEECRDRFGKLVSHGVMRVSKVIHGVKVPSLEEHFEQMLDCPIATVLKPADRINNLGSMVGVFKLAKQQEQVAETEQYIIPMMKKARVIFADQQPAYENLKLVMRNQLAMLKALHQAMAAQPA